LKVELRSGGQPRAAVSTFFEFEKKKEH